MIYKYKRIHWLYYFILSLTLVLFDQYTKLLVLTKLKDSEPIVIIRNVFEFSYVENRGAAFGFFQGGKIPFIIMTLIICPAIIFIMYRIEKAIISCGNKKTISKYYGLQIIFVLLLAGAIGNFIDRVFRDYVIDFLYFKLIDFPVFNIADCYVTIATFCLIIYIFILKEDEISKVLSFKKKK